MRIAISVETKDGLDSIVAHHFGRCPFFALIDVEGKNVTGVELIDNPFYSGHQPGQVPGFIKEMGADVMLSGGMGGRAIHFFQQFDICFTIPSSHCYNKVCNSGFLLIKFTISLRWKISSFFDSFSNILEIKSKSCW